MILQAFRWQSCDQKPDMTALLDVIQKCQIDAVCFDAFGTVVEICRPSQPFVPFFRALPALKRKEFKHRLMREDRNPEDWPSALQVEIAPEIIKHMVEAIEMEVRSIRIRCGMASVWNKITAAGLKISVCSNLTSSYGSAVRQSLPGPILADVFSYKYGAIKPEPEIYAAVVERLGMKAQKVLFVGDTSKTDIEGPAKIGFHTMHISELNT